MIFENGLYRRLTAACRGARRRATIFEVRVGDQGATTVSVFEGAVEVVPRLAGPGGRRIVVANVGQSITLGADGGDAVFGRAQPSDDPALREADSDDGDKEAQRAERREERAIAREARQTQQVARRTEREVRQIARRTLLEARQTLRRIEKDLRKADRAGTTGEARAGGQTGEGGPRAAAPRRPLASRWRMPAKAGQPITTAVAAMATLAVTAVATATVAAVAPAKATAAAMEMATPTATATAMAMVTAAAMEMATATPTPTADRRRVRAPSGSGFLI